MPLKLFASMKVTPKDFARLSAIRLLYSMNKSTQARKFYSRVRRRRCLILTTELIPTSRAAIRFRAASESERASRPKRLIRSSVSSRLIAHASARVHSQPNSSTRLVTSCARRGTSSERLRGVRAGRVGLTLVLSNTRGNSAAPIIWLSRALIFLTTSTKSKCARLTKSTAKSLMKSRRA